MNVLFNPQPKNPFESGVSSSKPELITGKFIKWIADNHIDLVSIITEEELEKTVQDSRVLHMGVTAKEVVIELKKLGYLKEIIPEKIKKDPAPVEHVELRSEKLSGLTVVEDEELLKQFQENERNLKRIEEGKLFLKELRKDIFKDEKDLDTIYEQAVSLGKEDSVDNLEYYYEFADAGFIKGGRKEVDKDWGELQQREAEFKEKDAAEGLEDIKKVSVIIERALAYCVSKLRWYGSQINIQPASRHDDVFKKIDEVLEVRNNDNNSFVGLGVDVTYSGLKSESYRGKIDNLLTLIQGGHSPKIKYFKDSSGKMKREFAVPKVVLHFNIDDVTELVYMVKNADNPNLKDRFKKSSIKVAVMNQILVQCELFEAFARRCHNPIADSYAELADSIRELAAENPELQQSIIEHKDGAVKKQIEKIITEFKA